MQINSYPWVNIKLWQAAPSLASPTTQRRPVFAIFRDYVLHCKFSELLAAVAVSRGVFNVSASAFFSKSCAQQASTTWVWTCGRPPTSTPSRRSSKSTMRPGSPSHKWPIVTHTSSPSLHRPAIDHPFPPYFAH